MRKLTATLAAALALAANTAVAENLGAFCRGIHATSEFIMLERQNHESMPDMIAATREIDDDKAALALASIVIQAFDRPAYMTSERKIKAAREFANEQYLKCIRRE